jgi:hypothetical protein
MLFSRWYVVGGGWGRAGFRCQGLNQESGFRSQEPGVRSEKEGHLLPAFCLLLSAFRRLPIALPTAYCIWGEFELSGLLPRCTVYDKMSPPAGKEKTSNFKN